MKANTPPDKVRITGEQIAEWKQQTSVLLDANCNPAEVLRDLCSRGCTPGMAAQIVANTQGPVRARHRLYGLRALLGGGTLALLGGVLYWKEFSDFQMGSDFHDYMHIGLPYVVLFSLLTAVLGVFKLLTGSAIDVGATVEDAENAVFGIKEDDLKIPLE